MQDFCWTESLTTVDLDFVERAILIPNSKSELEWHQTGIERGYLRFSTAEGGTEIHILLRPPFIFLSVLIGFRLV